MTTGVLSKTSLFRICYSLAQPTIIDIMQNSEKTNLIDTHCHIHDPEFFTSVEAEKALKSSVKGGVDKLICIGTSLEDSENAVSFANNHSKYCWASLGIHPHEAGKLNKPLIKKQLSKIDELAKGEKVIAIGECGFDFHYNDRTDSLEPQEQLLRGQIEIAKKHKLPISFHVRDAFDDFWRVFDDYEGIEGVLHSFTDNQANLDKALQAGLFIGINGIATFTNLDWQKQLFKEIPLENIVVETDSPFLTPHPKRGTINTPENVIYITKYLAELRGEEFEKIAKATTANAKKLFKL